MTITPTLRTFSSLNAFVLAPRIIKKTCNRLPFHLLPQVQPTRLFSYTLPSELVSETSIKYSDWLTNPNPPSHLLAYANLTKSPASSIEPLEQESRELIEQGSSLLEKGDAQGAFEKYQRPTGFYNLGIALYQLKKIPEAIDAWNQSLSGSPSADVHTNLASAYILSKPPQPFKALEHLKKAVELDPSDGEIRFNLGAVNEANHHLTDALAEYTQARQLGVKRAEQNIRNVGAKLLRQRLEEEALQKK